MSQTDEVVIPGVAEPNAPTLISTEEMEELCEEISSPNKSTIPTTGQIAGKIFQIRQASLEEKNPPDEIEEVAAGSSDNGSEMTKSGSFCSAVDEIAGQDLNYHDADDFLHDEDFLSKSLHVFILSAAGKPIYTLHGSEDKLATIFGVMQAIVSVVQSEDDNLKAINAGGVQFVFLVKNPIILVAISKTKKSVPQLQMLLHDVYNQILSTLTQTTLVKVYENRKNFDLRRLLSGSERLISHLLLTDVKTKGSKYFQYAILSSQFSFVDSFILI